MHFWSFLVKYWHFLPISSRAQPKTNANKVPRWVFRYVGSKTFDFSRKICFPKIGIFVHFGQAMPAHLVPCWWIGWWLWRARCISQDTYLLYLFVCLSIYLFLFIYFQNARLNMKPNVRTLTSEFLLCVHPKDLSIFLQDRVHARVHHVVSAFLRLKFLRLKFDGLKTTVPSSPFFSYSTQCSTEYITTSEEQCSDVIK